MNDDLEREISRVARTLHAEWDSPELWPRIREALAAELAPGRRLGWRWAAAAAAVLVAALVLLRPWAPAPSREFLTEAALRDVEKAEAAYARSIEKLSRLAEPRLRDSRSPLAASYHEKLLLLDSGIADLQRAVEENRYNVRLRAELGALYHDKQKTLQECLRQ